MQEQERTNTSSTRPLKGKVALITGATRGIGRAIALRLGREGAAIAISYLSQETLAREVVQAIEESGSQALMMQANIHDISSIRYLFQKTLETFQRIDIVVNNAATRSTLKPTQEITVEEYNTMFDNTRGVFFTMQEATRSMSEGGRIISISTAMTSVSMATAGAYVGSKAAIEQFSKSLAKEVGVRRITVNTISPGVTPIEGHVHHMIASRQAMTQILRTEEETTEATLQTRLKNILEQTPLGRLGSAEDIASVVALLVSEDASWITGQNICAAGGAI